MSSLSVGLKLLPRYMPEAGVKVKALQGVAGRCGSTLSGHSRRIAVHGDSIGLIAFLL
ncbi:hypothetical protein [Roseibium sediminicola]|uniref:Uncharacterized protein n=1 Tax=Roseibium sediminicola TaxID=2933272 RepID=A0ABT0GUK4_9HYPH|nr:hypothetical protein [Roseibium sp. CAU 1639]MCK7612550.1 hypothetical protein [Roseibium sp. CAU 1639]